METSLTHERFSTAWKFASRFTTGTNRSERMRILKGLTQRLISLGLGQTLFFLEKKDPDLFGCLKDHILTHVFKQPDGDLAELLMNGGNDYYLWATAEAREFAVWLEISASAQEG